MAKAGMRRTKMCIRDRKEAVSITSSLVLSELTASQRKGNAVTQQVNPKTAWTEARRMIRAHGMAGRVMIVPPYSA